MPTTWNTSLTRTLSLVICLGAGGCFIEAAEPSTFRFQCGSSSECATDQVCASGLCQQPCGGEDDLECPQSAPICLNEFCASVCPISEDVCPAPQSCVALTVPGDEPSESGVCTIPCGDANPCADGMLCVEEFGLCVQACATTDECGPAEACVQGFCVPTDSGGGAP
ncbi:hypothetical protein [Enhygromyxa salina]|uniref:Uncharacterized protein n=1 Tax=Enhygromyxa salina TaxID=215803 RepID=A0A2S9Y7W7_9BACT|nr:hypothetical protein [Enhygromyxa salina]PRQ01199.1 hypothetical protein ENSA7_58040 [Enhygromyxa salina]